MVYLPLAFHVISSDLVGFYSRPTRPTLPTLPPPFPPLFLFTDAPQDIREKVDFPSGKDTYQRTSKTCL